MSALQFKIIYCLLRAIWLGGFNGLASEQWAQTAHDLYEEWEEDHE